MTGDEVLAALALRYSRPEFFFFREASFGGSRMDALALCCYASRGWSTVGFEVKVDRGDWLRELAEPSKAEPLWSRVDAWIVVSPQEPEVVREAELPAGWGWMTATSRGCRSRRSPVNREAPVPMDREFLLRCLFKMEDYLNDQRQKDREELAAKAGEDRTALEAEVRRDLEYRAQGAPVALARLQERVAEFERHAGLKLEAPWPDEMKDLGQAVHAMLRLRSQVRDSATYIGERARQVVEDADALLKAVGGPRPEKRRGRR